MPRTEPYQITSSRALFSQSRTTTPAPAVSTTSALVVRPDAHRPATCTRTSSTAPRGSRDHRKRRRRQDRVHPDGRARPRRADDQPHGNGGVIERHGRRSSRTGTGRRTRATPKTTTVLGVLRAIRRRPRTRRTRPGWSRSRLRGVLDVDNRFDRERAGARLKIRTSMGESPQPRRSPRRGSRLPSRFHLLPPDSNCSSPPCGRPGSDGRRARNLLLMRIDVSRRLRGSSALNRVISWVCFLNIAGETIRTRPADIAHPCSPA